MRRVALCCALLGFAACDPTAPDALSPVDAGATDVSDARAPDAEPAKTPQGPVGPLDLGMGDVRIGDVATATVSVRNDGPAALHRVLSPEPCPSTGPFCARSRSDVVAEGAAFTFVVEFRPTPSRGGERERAELVVERGGDAPWAIVVDGRGTEAWPIRCFLPPTRPRGPGGCAEVTIRCLNEGRKPLWLEELTVDTDGAARWLDDAAQLPPVRLGDDAARFDLQLCPPADAPFEARLRWRAAAAPGGPMTAGTSEAIMIRPGVPQLGAPETVVVPVASGVAPVRLENRGAAPLVLWDLEVDAPFELNPWFNGFRPVGVLPRRARVEPNEALELFVHYDFENLPEDAPVQGQLRLRSSDRPDPVVVELRTDPPAPPPCALSVPADLHLGTIGPPRLIGPEEARDRAATHAFVIPIENVGDQTCWVTAEVDGFLAEVLRYPRPPEGFDDEAQTSDSFFVPPGAIQRLRIEPQTDLAPGGHEGAVRFAARGLTEPGPAVRVRARVTDDGAAVRVGGRRVPDATCGAFDRFTVIVDDAEVQSAALSGALAPFARLSTDVALPTSGPVALSVDPEGDRPGGGSLFLDVETSVGALTVPLALGGGDQPSGRVEHFGDTRSPQVDIVLLVDDSASMSPRRELLFMNWMAYLTYNAAQALDYRLFLATTTNPTRIVSASAAELPYVHPRSQPSPRTRFAERLKAIRFDGSGHERVADAAFAAVEASAPHLRPEAVLTVIAATDERDASATPEADAPAMLAAAKPTPADDDVSFSVVSGGTDGCAGPGIDGPSAEPAPRLDRWAESSGGRRASICAGDFSRSFEDWSRGWAPGYRLFLREQPNVGSLAVVIDDVSLPGSEPSGRINWIWDFSTNAVAFTPLAIPSPGARIRVEYETCH